MEDGMTLEEGQLQAAEEGWNRAKKIVSDGMDAID
jgi:hypothetical protein